MVWSPELMHRHHARIEKGQNPPLALLKNAKHINRLVMRGPYRWMPDELLSLADQYLNLAGAPQDLETYCLAIKLRVICSNSLDWETSCRIVDAVPDTDPRTDHRTLS